MAKSNAGRPKVLVRRHVLEVKEDTREWIEGLGDSLLNQHTAYPKTRAVGAAFAAAGVYGLVLLMIDVAKKPGEVVEDLRKDLKAQNPDAPDWALALGTFGDLGFTFLNLFGAGIEKKPGIGLGVGSVETPADFMGLSFDPIAFSAAMMAGGLVLAGLNPGEVLKGIGSIIDAVIPF